MMFASAKCCWCFSNLQTPQAALECQCLLVLQYPTTAGHDFSIESPYTLRYSMSNLAMPRAAVSTTSTHVAAKPIPRMPQSVPVPDPDRPCHPHHHRLLRPIDDIVLPFSPDCTRRYKVFFFPSLLSLAPPMSRPGSLRLWLYPPLSLRHHIHSILSQGFSLLCDRARSQRTVGLMLRTEKF